MNVHGVELMPRRRYQRGEVVERSGVFYLRFYVTKLVHGKLTRSKVTERLVERDAKHSSVKATAVKRLAAKRMVEVNEQQAQQPRRAVLVNDFFTGVYLPWVKQNRTRRTAIGYEKLWKLYLEKPFAGRTLTDFTAADGCQLLNSLTDRLNRNSLARVRALGSVVFGHAVNTPGLITQNPWTEVKVTARVRKPEPTVAYTAEERLAILNKIERLDAKVWWALMACAGCSPAEAIHARWEHFSDGYFYITASNADGGLKTENRRAQVLVIEPLRSLLEAWRTQCGSVTAGFLFPSSKRKDEPVSYSALARNHVKPLVAKEKWHANYANRRGVGTDVAHESSAHHLASAAVLRNTPETSERYYIKPRTTVGDDAMKALEQRLLKIKEE